MTVALHDSYQELLHAWPREPVLGLDETGLRHKGKGHWVWCAHAPGSEGLTCFAIDPSRGSCVLNDIIIGLIRRAPDRHEPRKIKKRFQNHGRSYFTFIDLCEIPGAGVEPTNNATERQIRFVVLDRKVTQGTKGVIGNLWCERIWSTVATCRQRGKPIFEFLLDTFNAHLRDKLTPSLIYA